MLKNRTEVIMKCPKCDSDKTIEFPVSGIKTVKIWVCKRCANLWEVYTPAKEEKTDEPR